MNTEIRKSIVSSLVKELRSSTVRSSDADWYIGFKDSAQTQVEETEIDPRTGKIVNNTTVGDRATFLQQWDRTGKGYLEGEERDSGTYSFKAWKTLQNPL